VQEVARQYLTRQPLVVISGDFRSCLDALADLNKIEIYNEKGQLKAICEKGVVKNANR